MVDSAQQGAALVQAMRYPQDEGNGGVRGMAGARASRWGRYPNYAKEANDRVCLLVQAETRTALQNLDAIAATPGVDGVFIGPADLSASMGHVGDPNHPEVQAAIEDAIARILKAGKAPGILTSDERRRRATTWRWAPCSWRWAGHRHPGAPDQCTGCQVQKWRDCCAGAQGAACTDPRPPHTHRMTRPAKPGRFRSATIYEGTLRSHRSFLHALGKDDRTSPSHIGVFHTGGEMSPCNLNLREQAQHAKTGIYAAGGTPHECPVVSISDGLTMAHSGMRFSLISRELIADSVEASVRGHQWDGIFGIGACDKNLPGLMMGMVRCNVPSVFVHGGSALPGQMPGADGRDLNVVDTYETIGKVLAGDATLDELDAISQACLPTAGACAGQFTANTMGMVSEALGLAPIGSSMVPAVFSERAPLMRRAGKQLMKAVMGDAPLPRDIVTRQALENACAVVSATGGSTKPRCTSGYRARGRHQFHLDDVAEVFARTPLIADLRPGGKYLARDMYYVGGAAVVLHELLNSGHLHGDTLTWTGRTLAEELDGANAPDGEVVRRFENAISQDGGLAVSGNCALRRAVEDGRPEDAGAPRSGARVRVRRGRAGRRAGHALPAG
jgi:hypothetical protein